MEPELECPACDQTFKTEWGFGDNVKCPHCQRLFETDWETNGDDDVFGPWITKQVQP
jgi:sarcosine oxidase delta subunit